MDISKEVIQVCSVLKKGGVILYPTDSIWGIGCDATNYKAIEKVIHIKRRPIHKSMIILVDELDKIKQYVDKIPIIALDLISQTTRPTTFIYPNVKNLPKNLISPDKSIAIRITTNDFCRRLIRLLGVPIVSTSANISGDNPALTFYDIQQEIVKQVDYVVNPNIATTSASKPSTIIRFLDDYSFEIIRE